MCKTHSDLMNGVIILISYKFANILKLKIIIYHLNEKLSNSVSLYHSYWNYLPKTKVRDVNFLCFWKFVLFSFLSRLITLRRETNKSFLVYTLEFSCILNKSCVALWQIILYQNNVIGCIFAFTIDNVLKLKILYLPFMKFLGNLFFWLKNIYTSDIDNTSTKWPLQAAMSELG